MVSLFEVSYSDSVCFELISLPDYRANFGSTRLLVLLRVKPGLILIRLQTTENQLIGILVSLGNFYMHDITVFNIHGANFKQHYSS